MGWFWWNSLSSERHHLLTHSGPPLSMDVITHSGPPRNIFNVLSFFLSLPRSNSSSSSRQRRRWRWGGWVCGKWGLMIREHFIPNSEWASFVAADAYELKTLECAVLNSGITKWYNLFSTNWPFHKKKKKGRRGPGGSPEGARRGWACCNPLITRVRFRSCSWQFVSLIRPFSNPFERSDDLKQDGGKHVVSLQLQGWGGGGGGGGEGYVISSPQKWHYPQLQRIIFPGLVLSKFRTSGWVGGWVGGPKRSRDQTPLMWSTQYDVV